MVIEPDEGESESHDEGAYAAFEDAIEVEGYEALSFGLIWYVLPHLFPHHLPRLTIYSI